MDFHAFVWAVNERVVAAAADLKFALTGDHEGAPWREGQLKIGSTDKVEWKSRRGSVWATERNGRVEVVGIPTNATPGDCADLLYPGNPNERYVEQDESGVASLADKIVEYLSVREATGG